MNAPTERSSMDAHDLYLACDRFISDNKSDRRVEMRWLALMLGQVRSLALGLKTSGVAALSDADQARIRDFRLGEIEAAKADLAKQQTKLDDEARRLGLSVASRSENAA